MQYPMLKPVISRLPILYIPYKTYNGTTPKPSVPTLLTSWIPTLNPALPLLTEKGVIEKGLHFIKITHYFNLKSYLLFYRETFLVFF
ncbi:hypothetical protein, partial [Staphylococcus chromogenes]|uniref:hypothetical protein n=1 Tax=Staphylococcus chromogenes TaxID=46126 RepID=UPI003D7B03B6